MAQREGGTDAPSSYADAAKHAASPGSPSSSEESCGWTPPESTWPFLSGHFPAARLQHVANRHIFNAGLCTSDSPDAPTVRVVAADFADVSDWFMGALRQRDAMASGSLDRVLVPCDVGHGVLQEVVNAMYQGCITIDKDSFAPLLQLGDALLIPALTDACVQWALQALQQEGCSSQWASQLHGVLGALQVKLPNVERAMLEAVVVRCLPAMHAPDLQVLVHMLTDRRQKAAARCDCTARDADTEMVEQLRSCLQTLFGPNWPEVFLLLLLLLRMDQLGLPVGPLAQHLNADCLHPADVRAVVQHVLGPDAEQLQAVVEVVHMLLKAAVEPAATGSLLHVAHTGWCQASTGAPVVLQLPTQFGPAKLTVKKRSGAIHISLEAPTRVTLPQICDYLFLYTIDAAGMRLHKFDRRSHNARATRDVTTLEIAAHSSSGVPLAKDVVWGVFLVVHEHDRDAWYIPRSHPYY